MKRRNFLKTSAAGVGGAALAPTIIPSKVWGQAGSTFHNSKINMGFIGVGGMGTNHLKRCVALDDVRVVAVCDVFESKRQAAKARVDAQYGDDSCATYNDFRVLLARPDIDAVCISTPDYWHVLMGMEAARQGKAMYYEKPMSLTAEEAKAMRDCINRYGVTFQFGTQQRSDARFRYVVELFRNHYLGEPKRIVIGSASYVEVGPQPVEPVPEELDYDLWLGPSPIAPYTTLRCTRNWTLIRDYSLGCLSGAWGIHHVDIAQWAMDADDAGPVAVEGWGQRPAEGLYDTFQYFEVEHTYPNGLTVLHVDHIKGREKVPQLNAPNSMGVLFEGSEGWVYVARGYIDSEPKSLIRTPILPSDIRLPVSPNHWRNFLDAVRNGTPTICPVGPGVKSELVCQQAEIACQLGRRLYWDNDQEAFINDAEANALLSRPMRSPWTL